MAPLRRAGPVRPQPAIPPAMSPAIPLAIGVVAFLVYWFSNRQFDAGRRDFFYLADAFLHGRMWIDANMGPYDVILRDGRLYVPFAPFPAVALMPLVAVVGPEVAGQWEQAIGAGLAATAVVLAWVVTGRAGVLAIRDRAGLTVLLGFSTAIWWVTTRGGVWHTGHVVAVILTLVLLLELFGRQRPLFLGLLMGAAFLTRAPVIFAAPFVGFLLVRDWGPILAPGRSLIQRMQSLPWRTAAVFAAGMVPALLYFGWYNVVRFGSVAESGYALALLPEWLAVQRDRGLFSLVHVPMNLDLLFLRLPTVTADAPFLRPDGLGMSILFTSPGLLLFLRAPWRDARARLLAGAVVVVLVPTLLYYGGGWLQYGYRYALDSIPFLWALCVLGVVHRGPIPRAGWIAIAWGVAINALGVYWAYHL